MSFYLLFACGFAGGLLGGMGMGGGTLLIPLLTLFLGLNQAAAQGINLLSFLPMSLVALGVHAKAGRIQTEGLSFLIAPALIFSGALAFFAAALPSAVLKKGFGLFLVLLSAFPFAAAWKGRKEKEKKF